MTSNSSSQVADEHSSAPVAAEPLGISSNAVFKLLLACIITLCAIQLVSNWFFVQHPPTTELGRQLRERFDLDSEANIPSYYSALVIFFCSTTFGVISLVQKRSGVRWWRQTRLLWGTLLFLSFDEAAMIHELVDKLTKHFFPRTGPVAWPWVFPYVGVAGALGVYFIPFLRALPRGIALRFIIGGFIYVLGAAGMDALEGYVFARNGWEQANMLGATAELIEEGMEMFGMAFTFVTALQYLGQQIDLVRIRVR